MAARECGHRKYTKGCTRCQTHSRRQRKRERLQDIGRARGELYDSDSIPCGPAQNAILAAKKAGIPLKEMSRLSGCGPETLRRIKNGDPNTCTIWRKTSTKVCRALYEAIDDPSKRDILAYQNVDPTRTKQIVHSLNAQGWTIPHLIYIVENNTGLTAGGLLSVTRESKKFVNQITEDKAEWLARQIGNGIGPSKTTRRKTINRGYFPLRHYNVKGELIVSSLSTEQRVILQGVQS